MDGLDLGGVLLHRSTGLRLTAIDRWDGAQCVGLLHPLLSSRESSSCQQENKETKRHAP